MSVAASVRWRCVTVWMVCDHDSLVDPVCQREQLVRHPEARAAVEPSSLAQNESAKGWRVEALRWYQEGVGHYNHDEYRHEPRQIQGAQQQHQRGQWPDKLAKAPHECKR